MMDGATSYVFPPDEALGLIQEAIERLVHVEAKLDGFAARQDARFLETRERLVHAEERLDFLLARLAQPAARRVAFLHVPKCAGTSFSAALIQAVKPRCAVGGFDRCLFGGFEDFGSLAPELRRDVYVGAQEISPFGDMLAGHFGLSTIRAWAPDAAVVMVLREPSARLLSHWTFWRSELTEAKLTMPGWDAYAVHTSKPLGGFLESREVACQTDNVAVRMLLWPHELIPAEDFIAPAHDEVLLAAAGRRLAALAFVNVIENPELGADVAGWLKRGFELRRLKVTPAVPAAWRTDLDAELTPAARAALADRTRLDRVLWARVCRRVMAGVDDAVFGAAVLAGAVERYRALLAGG